MHSHDDGSVNPGTNLFVTGLSLRVRDEDVEQLFSKYGKLTKCNIMYDPHSRESRGFAFVSFEAVEDADRARAAVSGVEFMGRILTVELARRARARTPTPGRYYGPPKRLPPPTVMDRRYVDRFDPRYDRPPRYDAPPRDYGGPRGPPPDRGYPVDRAYTDRAYPDRAYPEREMRDRSDREYRPSASGGGSGYDRGYADRAGDRAYDREHDRRPMRDVRDGRDAREPREPRGYDSVRDSRDRAGERRPSYDRPPRDYGRPPRSPY
ncbi:hypothetical protein HK102_011637 [Quaeritorhiza haematococci]|nr:hypothetical protein HK102_011637 [Quaeritorhiza haematococci]